MNSSGQVFIFLFKRVYYKCGADLPAKEGDYDAKERIIKKVV